MKTLLHINAVGMTGIRVLLKGLKHDATDIGCGSVWSEAATATCPPHIIITNPSPLVLDRLNAGNVPYVITLDDVDETPALIVGTWTEPGCGAH